MKNIRLSSIVLFLTVLQFLFTHMLAFGIVSSAYFTVQHEDYIFIAHLITYFIVRAIEIGQLEKEK